MDSTLLESLEAARYGGMQTGIVRGYDQADLSGILQAFGLHDLPQDLKVIDSERARLVLRSLLWKDLAYHAECMAESTAIEFADRIVTEFVTPAGKIFTNSTDWEGYHTASVASFNPMTDATFNGGVIVVEPEYAVCVWVEDED